MFVNREQATDEGSVMDVVQADAQIDAFIERRSRQSTEQRPEEEAWKESVRTYNTTKEAERREAWANYHAGQASRLRRVMTNLVAFHETKARQLSSE
jgi:hypothetical protein